MTITEATNPATWDAFIQSQPFAPFLQSWTMGEVYADVGQQPVRLEIKNDEKMVGICFGHIVAARRGRHISIPYGPLFDRTLRSEDFAQLLPMLYEQLREIAKKHTCSFIRISPFLTSSDGQSLTDGLRKAGAKVLRSPLHLLAEHVWYLPLITPDPWRTQCEKTMRISEEDLLISMRKTTRNLIRRAEKEGVTIEASGNPNHDIEHFLRLHDETRKRHGFTPYSNAFFRAQVRRFSEKEQCRLYVAHYQDHVIATSIHMHCGDETSYHHGASADAFKKIPSSYLLQWTAIKDALKRGDKIYNFWGIAPLQSSEISNSAQHHPFSGVTLFKTGFGGAMLSLAHCMDIPVSSRYHMTRAIEIVRKWRRGF